VNTTAGTAATRLVLVEDDSAIAVPLTETLERHGFAVHWVRTGQEALDLESPSFVLLDLGLPDIDGMDVCKALRAKFPTLPIIITSARGEDIDRVVGLELGADDYLVKPFNARELVARIRALLRRAEAHSHEGGASPLSAPSASTTSGAANPGTNASQSNAGAPPNDQFDPGRMYEVGELVVDLRSHRVLMSGEELQLTTKEFGVLALLAADPGAVVTRSELIERVWDEHWYGPTKTLDVHIAQLRKKLGSPDWIETVRSIGYRLVNPAS
jgi:two-component system, OmpR family, response regulator RegX3